jgi:DNA-binding NarL/FixJ family response regulator
MPDVDGTELIQQIKAVPMPPRVLVLSVATDRRSVLEVFEAGADGFLGKHEPLAVVLDAARAIMGGDVPISASAFARLLPTLVPSRRSNELTRREDAVLALIAEGRSNEDIATELNISPNTARNHVSNILDKLQAESRTQAVVIARKSGLLPEA